MLHDWRDYLDATASTLILMIALYYRVPKSKRDAFEAKNPRIAALIGMVAALVPFLPMLAHHAKQLISGTPSEIASTDSTPPQAPWHESGAHSQSGSSVLPSRDDPGTVEHD